MDKYIGKRLDGRYVIKEILGVGGMAVVYKAYDNIEDRIVAIKILKDEFLFNENFRQRFANESKAIAVLSHPNIVKVFDVSLGNVIQYIVMEYIEGITLKQHIEDNGSLLWRDAVNYTVLILRALQHAHDRGIVHRDVKPQNIMLLPDGTIKVTDFGIARFAKSEQQTITDKAIGSVHYISPEQARGEVTDEKSDVYSVGVILYEILTGCLPFEADSAVSVAIMQLQNDPKSPRDINPSIPEGLEQITMHAMKKDPNRRYKSAAEMLCDLEELRRDPSVLFEYDYFVDDSPTKFIDIKTGEQTDVSEEENSKTPIIPVLAGIAAAFVVALGVIAWIFLPSLFESKGTSINCPNFVGMKYSDITKSDEYSDLKFDVTYEYSSDKEVGVVIEQSPAEGRSIKTTQTIKLTVSQGGKMLTVPDVYTLTESTAVSTLKTDGFKVKITYKHDDEVASGLVIATNPPRNDSVYEKSEIEVFVSTGKMVIYVNVPDVIGLSESEAKKEIEAEGLTLGTVKNVDSSTPKGCVVSQDPSSKSSQVARGSAINISVSTGVAPVQEYSYKLTVDIPAALSGKVINVVAYIDGVSIHESKQLSVDDLSGRKYAFNINTTKETGSVTVKVRESTSMDLKDISKYVINFKDSKIVSSNQFPIDSE
ncbi:MAG: Stk1 family PASTA domain-containing Ser/Thr kinase [bacterium]|nr:Stk1 family PASTA domain-containing Ser/Thr kinase [bacterium]